MNDKVQAIEHMLESVGWQMVEKYMKERIEGSKNQLLSCPLEKVSEHRAEAKALNGVLLYIQRSRTEGDEDE